jgi:hypothetical protein
MNFVKKHSVAAMIVLMVVISCVQWHYNQEAWDAARAAQSQAHAAEKAMEKIVKLVQEAQDEASRAADNAGDARKSAEIIHTSKEAVTSQVDKLAGLFEDMRDRLAHVNTQEPKGPGGGIAK